MNDTDFPEYGRQCELLTPWRGYHRGTIVGLNGYRFIIEAYFDIVSDNLSAFIGNAMTLCGYEIRFMLYGASNPGQYSFISRSLKTLMSSMVFLQFQQSGVNAFSL